MMSVERGPIGEVEHNLEVGLRITGSLLGPAVKRVWRLADFDLAARNMTYRIYRYIIDPEGGTLWQGDQNRLRSTKNM